MPVKRLSVADLLPATHHYMTYDGSTTVPACHETVTWLILNKPIYITKQQVKDNNTPFSNTTVYLGVLTRSADLIAREIKFNRRTAIRSVWVTRKAAFRPRLPLHWKVLPIFVTFRFQFENIVPKYVLRKDSSPTNVGSCFFSVFMVVIFSP